MMDRDGANLAKALPSRALVVREPETGSPRDKRPLADFLAQLIACDLRLPAYRTARMTEPRRAASAYGSRAGAPAGILDCVI